MATARPARTAGRGGGRRLAGHRPVCTRYDHRRRIARAGRVTASSASITTPRAAPAASFPAERADTPVSTMPPTRAARPRTVRMRRPASRRTRSRPVPQPSRAEGAPRTGDAPPPPRGRSALPCRELWMRDRSPGVSPRDRPGTPARRARRTPVIGARIHSVPDVRTLVRVGDQQVEPFRGSGDAPFDRLDPAFPAAELRTRAAGPPIAGCARTRSRRAPARIGTRCLSGSGRVGPSRDDQSVLVAEHHGLDPVPQAELLQNPADVCLGGRLGDEQ